jgi:hypothetical protein
VFTCTLYSQKESSDLSQSKNQFSINFAAGASSPSSSFSDDSFASTGFFFELSGDYYFSKIGVGLTLGSLSNPTDKNFSDTTNSFEYPTMNSTENWKAFYYGIGPEFKTSFSKIEAAIITRFGMLSVNPAELTASYDIGIADISSDVIRFGTSESTSLGYFSAGIRLGYKLNSNLSLFFLANYLSAFSDDLTITQSTKNVQDTNKDGVIDAKDFVDADGQPIEFKTTQTTTKPQFMNFGLGITYTFSKRTIKNGGTEKPYARSQNTNPYFVDNQLQGDMPAMNSGSVVFTNPSKENKSEALKLVNVLPVNNSTFKDTKSIGNFNWKVIGREIPNAQFIIEVTKINQLRKPERSFAQTTTQTSIKSADIFKDAELTDGQYMWKVTETSTGISSNPSFFTMTNCDINFSVANDTIECLGYEGENRKFKICFDATYQSNTGNLTYVNAGSGLTVYDQTYAPLSYTLVSPNPTLLTQVGATTTTVSYCFEVVVSNSVTSIGFGLQGDDLDPSPILCQPGVSANFDELPDCLCNDCEEIELSFDNFNISPNGSAGNAFNFNGSINVNVPIYGIEFQVQSYSYSANPSACTDGVSSVEESGMILMPGTTINSSTSLQLSNETVSGSSSTNNNATKNIKYTSNTALTGPIPVNLTIGLPGPISGLDPSCCVIDYTVCIKVKIYYDKDSCKSCVFTHCFNFNNQ